MKKFYIYNMKKFYLTLINRENPNTQLTTSILAEYMCQAIVETENKYPGYITIEINEMN